MKTLTGNGVEATLLDYYSVRNRYADRRFSIIKSVKGMCARETNKPYISFTLQCKGGKIIKGSRFQIEDFDNEMAVFKELQGKLIKLDFTGNVYMGEPNLIIEGVEEVPKDQSIEIMKMLYYNFKDIDKEYENVFKFMNNGSDLAIKFAQTKLDVFLNNLKNKADGNTITCLSVHLMIISKFIEKAFDFDKDVVSDVVAGYILYCTNTKDEFGLYMGKVFKNLRVIGYENSSTALNVILLLSELNVQPINQEVKYLVELLLATRNRYMNL